MDLSHLKTNEDLREQFITPLYLQTMEQRARIWSSEFIQQQLSQFLQTIPDYPEVLEILEGELHRRKLNEIRKKARKLRTAELNQLMKSLTDPDQIEVVETEIQIRRGVVSLPDASA